jgi:2-polyprenyl-6-methoxyphenol hydroxylase-like FAD-dependent oxidoreductase
MVTIDTEVLIVGAGPTGLMLANQLVRRGIRTLIIDHHAGPAQQSRALGVQARTLEIYAKLGIAERALGLGKRGSGANLWADGRLSARVPFGDSGRTITPYPFILILGQDDNERLLGDRLRDSGLSVRWNTELTALQQNGERVTATLKQPDGSTRTLEAAWAAGCDGAHSAVRGFSGIEFPGAPYQHVFFVADVEVTGNMVPDEVNVYLWKDGVHLFFPMRGERHWRIVGILPAGLRDREPLNFEDVVPSLQGEAGASFSFQACSWFSTYRIAHRCASTFRNGRCFVLGDAAHIHSPVGAQGMNTGLQDAYNLGWKLALVAAGRADERLLDTYEGERLPVARQLLNTTDRAFKLVISDSPVAGLLRMQVVARFAALAMRRAFIQKFAFLAVSQTGIRYRRSSLSAASALMPAGAPQAGDRFPWLRLICRADGPVEDLFLKLDDTRFNLLAFGQSLPQQALPDFGNLLNVLVIPGDAGNKGELARACIARPSYYLLRPDGYIGLCGLVLEPVALRQYASDQLGIR